MPSLLATGGERGGGEGRERERGGREGGERGEREGERGERREREGVRDREMGVGRQGTCTVSISCLVRS